MSTQAEKQLNHEIPRAKLLIIAETTTSASSPATRPAQKKKVLSPHNATSNTRPWKGGRKKLQFARRSFSHPRGSLARPIDNNNHHPRRAPRAKARARWLIWRSTSCCRRRPRRRGARFLEANFASAPQVRDHLQLSAPRPRALPPEIRAYEFRERKSRQRGGRLPARRGLIINDGGRAGMRGRTRGR